MRLHEYQAKQLLAHAGILVPQERVVDTPEAAVTAAQGLGQGPWLLKVQIHAGARGKAGGVCRCETLTQVQQIASRLLGSSIQTEQSAGHALPVDQLLVTPVSAIIQELYLSMLVDRRHCGLTVLASACGGQDIEEVAQQAPDKISTITLNIIEAVQPYHARELGFALGLSLPQIGQLAHILDRLYHLLLTDDLSLIEMNPLAILANGQLCAMDAKIEFDDSAAFRHPDIVAMQDPRQMQPIEYRAKQLGLQYVALEGSIACMVNGAGLAMATMDLIMHYGGSPANFLDVGGNTTQERVTEAVKLILASTQIKAILINIFGGIVRCDLIAQGILIAAQQQAIKVPIVVRLQGTNRQIGHQLLAESGLGIMSVDNLDEGAKMAVALASAQTGLKE